MHPDAQGKGAGQALLRAMMEEASDRGIWQLELYVNERNHRAVSLYQKYGFRQVGLLPNSVMTDTGPENDLFMVCELREA